MINFCPNFPTETWNWQSIEHFLKSGKDRGDRFDKKVKGNGWTQTHSIKSTLDTSYAHSVGSIVVCIQYSPLTSAPGTGRHISTAYIWLFFMHPLVSYAASHGTATTRCQTKACSFAFNRDLVNYTARVRCVVISSAVKIDRKCSTHLKNEHWQRL